MNVHEIFESGVVGTSNNWLDSEADQHSGLYPGILFLLKMVLLGADDFSDERHFSIVGLYYLNIAN